MTDELLRRYQKTKGREWLEHSAKFYPSQDQAKAALEESTISENQDFGDSY